MQRQSLQRLFLTVLTLTLLSTSAARSQAKGTALVIGNGGYQFSPLTSSTNDARDISETLKKMGFAVTLVLDADQAAIEKNINDFGKKLHNGGTGLFYYSGHGVQHAGGNYLVPIGTDTAISTPEQLRYKAVNVGYVIGVMKEAGNSLNIVILDACRNSPFKGFIRSVDRGLVREQGAEGMIIAYATSPGKVALDGSGRNSPYTKHLLSQMTVANVPIEIMFKNVRSAVVKETSGEQTPWYESSIEGDFTFVRRYGGSVSSAPVVERVTPRVVMPIQPTPTPQLSETEKRVEAEKLKRQIAAGEVVEFIAGVGFKGFPVGSTAEQVQEVFGEPDDTWRGQTGTVYRYRPDKPFVEKPGGKYYSHALTFDAGGQMIGVTIDDHSMHAPGFSALPVRTAKGVTFGDSREDVMQKYGTPTKTSDVSGDGIFYLIFGEQGISFNFAYHKMNSMSISPPRAR